MEATAVDRDDIQGLVIAGYGNLKAACFVLLEVVDRAPAAEWLGFIADSITPCSAKPDAQAINLALTPSGLRNLGVSDDVVDQFSNEFVGGMTTAHRTRILGDTGESAAEHWRWGGPENPDVDLLLLLYAVDEAQLTVLYDGMAGAFERSGLREIAKLQTAPLDVKEPFGFNDGISQPVIEGLPREGRPEDLVKTGEMVLGYRNEYGLYTDRPRLAPTDDSGDLLPADPADPSRRDLGRNGTYLVVRHLEQDVHGFWRYLDAVTRGSDGTPNADARARLGAKLVGRWPSGAPLVLSPDRDDDRLGDANDFGYGRHDPVGLSCPVGAHIRRANPRDSLDPDPGTERSTALNKRHRLLRRGRKYGPEITPEQALSDEPDSEERGLYFISLNANIARQFEFVQHTWVNNPKFDGLYEDVDPLLGPRGDHGASHTIQAAPVRARLSGLPRFVTVRGGGYFFLPGIRAIRWLASR